MSSRLALGTVQFGLQYGVANRATRVSRDEAARIVEHARRAGLDTLDTATGYGDSEERLGEFGVASWQIVSKLPRVPAGCLDVASWVSHSLSATLSRLRVPHLHGLLLHHPHDLLESYGDELHGALKSEREAGRVTKIGVSIYGPEELEALIPRFRFDLVQGPFNVVDRRLAASGWFRTLRAAGTEIHVRSAFLQGLLLMSRATRPANFDRWDSLWRLWESWLEEQGMTPLEACIGFALSQDAIDRVVVGVDSLGQLQEILGAAARSPCAPPAALAVDDPDLINPSRWRLH